jgi:hypothetical protein
MNLKNHENTAVTKVSEGTGQNYWVVGRYIICTTVDDHDGSPLARELPGVHGFIIFLSENGSPTASGGRILSATG